MSDIKDIIQNKIFDNIINYTYVKTNIFNHAEDFIKLYLTQFNDNSLKKQLNNKSFFNNFLYYIEHFKFYINIYNLLYENTNKTLKSCMIRTKLLIDEILLLPKNELTNDNLIKNAKILMKFELTNIFLSKITDSNTIYKFLTCIEKISFKETKDFYTNDIKFINYINMEILNENIKNKFSFTIDEIINEDIKDIMNNLNIKSEKELNIDNLKILFLDIYNKWNDELTFGISSTFDIIIIYLYSINELLNNLILTYDDLYSCLTKHGRFTDKYSMKELINNIIDNNYWLEEYINIFD